MINVLKKKILVLNNIKFSQDAVIKRQTSGTSNDNE